MTEILKLHYQRLQSPLTAKKTIFDAQDHFLGEISFSFPCREEGVYIGCIIKDDLEKTFDGDKSS